MAGLLRRRMHHFHYIPLPSIEECKMVATNVSTIIVCKVRSLVVGLSLHSTCSN